MSSVNTSLRLQELRGSEYEIATGEPDIRHWDVRDSSGLKIGKVSELILDTIALKVRYVVVDVDDVEELDLEKRTVLVPIGLARLDTKNEDVFFSAVTPFQLRALPRYDKRYLGAKTEWGVSQVFGREYTGSVIDDENYNSESSFYEHEHFNDAGLYAHGYRTDVDPVSAEQLKQERRFGLNLEKIHRTEQEQETLRHKH
jgi:hypothetical protein